MFMICKPISLGNTHRRCIRGANMTKDVLLILGNGFDLKSGLPARYSDFMNLPQERVDTIWYPILQSANKYKITSEDWFDVEGTLAEILLEFEPDLLVEILHCTLDRERKNLELKAHLNLIRMNQFRSSVSKFWTYYTNGAPIYSQTSIQKFLSEVAAIIRAKYNEECESFLNEFLPILSQKNISIENIRNYYMSEGAIWLEELLLYELQTFEHEFSAYLSDVISRNEQYQSNAEILFSNLLEQYDKLTNLNILSFNYTFPFNRISSEYTTFNMVNVHGTLQSDNIIFGIDASNMYSQDTNEIMDRIVPFTKTYRKMFLEKNLNWELPSQPNEIIFYGHSLSTADFSYFQSIFDHVDLYHSRVKLTFAYSNYANNKLQRTTIESNRVNKLINQYGILMTNKEQGKNLLHKLQLENRINLRLV